MVLVSQLLALTLSQPAPPPIQRPESLRPESVAPPGDLPLEPETDPGPPPTPHSAADAVPTTDGELAPADAGVEPSAELAAMGPTEVAPPLLPPRDRAARVDPFAPPPAARQATDSEPPPIARDARPAPTVTATARTSAPIFRRTPDRRGFSLSTTTGVTSCAAPLCADIAAGGLGRIELGYRFGTLGAFATVGYGGGRIKEERDSTIPDDGWLTFLDTGVGLTLFLIPEGIIDPYVSAALGYSRVKWYVGSGPGDAEELKFSRGAFRPTVGIPIAVSNRVRLGPRFDIVIPFSGKICGNAFYGDLHQGTDSCTPIADLMEEADSKNEKRQIRRALPKPWAITLEMLVVF